MSVDDVLDRIVAGSPAVSRKQVLARLEVERKRVGGLISDESLLRVIAAEFGVRLVDGAVEVGELSLGDLFSGLSSISVVGRVVAVLRARSYGTGAKSGCVASVLIVDRNAVVRVVLWNDKAGLIESGGLRVGQIVRFDGCYTKEDRRGNVELHVGEKSVVVADPSDVRSDDYPDISAFLTKIGEIGVKIKGGLVNVVGDVEEVFSASSFERKDSGVGRVLRLVLSDESGGVSVVVWNERVDELEKGLVCGVGLRLVNAKVKKGMSGEVELHVDSGTFAEHVASTLKRVVCVGDLREGMRRVSVEGLVVAKPAVRELKTGKGEVVRLASFELKDDSGRVWVSAWRKHAEEVEGLQVGVRVCVEDAYVKRGFGDQLEVSTRDSTRIIVKS